MRASLAVPTTTTTAALVLTVVGALTGCSTETGPHAPSSTACNQQADYAYLPDTAALADASDGVFVGAVDAVLEEDVDGVRTTVYQVEVRDVVRGEAPAGDELQVRETCTGDGRTTDPQLPVSDDDVLFFTTGGQTTADGPVDADAPTRTWSVSGAQGRLAAVDGGYRADVPGLDTPLVSEADLESLRRSASS